ncbi:hypothetical protein Calab_1454 [Caldithrix abyssi DSM 13497]|uniref:Uncharacterized protein n=1 Tax=Caldithrix abyssi DSM 13497 TaxID=880073 RepID=H1XPU9_CALAY|nr:hypothetical protein [Caldithrix abyssi]APF20397.1 hypothetical protein Cabys_3651 [Caldithrix abyssi DSM 13497]EHO41075.1 hypothetical protein Calab_1454 [Caldithrix abyssi DSM 13497]
MQANVDQILQIAQNTGHFQLVQDRVFDENEKYPAFVVGERRLENIEVMDDMGAHFNGEWRYEIFIIVKAKDGYGTLENIVNDFINALPAGVYQVEDYSETNNYISEQDTLLAHFYLVCQVEDVFGG